MSIPVKYNSLTLFFISNKIKIVRKVGAKFKKEFHSNQLWFLQLFLAWLTVSKKGLKPDWNE